MIIEHTNFSKDNDNSRLFECRTSISNPQAQLTVTRQTSDGEKHYDIQYKTSNSYINGINSLQFTVCFSYNHFLYHFLSIFSYQKSIFPSTKIF